MTAHEYFVRSTPWLRLSWSGRALGIALGLMVGAPKSISTEPLPRLVVNNRVAKCPAKFVNADLSAGRPSTSLRSEVR